jgi:hypothetical protein
MSSIPLEKIEEFKSITGSSDGVAKSYLSSVQNHDVSLAVSKFLDFQESQRNKPQNKKREPGKVNSLLDSENDDNDRDDQKKDYIGSGLNVLNEPKKDDDLYSQIMKKAQKQGQQGPPEEEKQETKSVDKWKGSGKKLGNTNVDVVLGNTNVDVVEKVPIQEEFTELDNRMSEEEQMAQIMKHINQQRGNQPPLEKEKSAKLTLYKNGYTINDGAFLPLSDPNNKKMLEELNNGTVPKGIRDIIGPAMSYAFQLDPREEDYVPPKEQFKLFGGGGRSLSTEGPKPAVVPTVVVKQALIPYTLDENKKVTSVQIRLPDGTVLKGKFNLDHTVGTIKAFITSSTTGLVSFSITTTFPRREYTNEDETIEKAGLQNASVNVVLK